MTEQVTTGTLLWYNDPRRSHEWRACEVCGETPGTWILYNRDRVNKKTMLTAKDRGGWQIRYYTGEERKALPCLSGCRTQTLRATRC